MKQKNVIKSAGLIGLAALAIGCGGGGGGTPAPKNATEVEGRNVIRAKLEQDLLDGKILSFSEDPLVEIQGITPDPKPDFYVEQLDGFASYVEYRNPSELVETENEYKKAFKPNGFDYLYAGATTTQGVLEAISDFSDLKYSGQFPAN